MSTLAPKLYERETATHGTVPVQVRSWGHRRSTETPPTFPPIRSLPLPVRDILAEWLRYNSSYLYVQFHYIHGLLYCYPVTIRNSQDEFRLEIVMSFQRYSGESRTWFLQFGSSHIRHFSSFRRSSMALPKVCLHCNSNMFVIPKLISAFRSIISQRILKARALH